MFKVNNRNTKQGVKFVHINNKDTKTTPMRRSGVFIVNLKHVQHLDLVFLLLTLSS